MVDRIIDRTGPNVQDVSLKLVTGQPQVAYTLGGNSDRVARFSYLDLDQNRWVRERVSSSGVVGVDISLFYAKDGTARIAYHNATADTAMVANAGYSIRSIDQARDGWYRDTIAQGGSRVIGSGISTSDGLVLSLDRDGRTVNVELV